MALPRAYVSRQCRGQLRFKVPSRKGDAGFFDHAANALSRLPALESFKMNPQTGSILLFHNSSLEDIARFAREQNLFTLAPRPHQVPPSRPSLPGNPRHAITLLVLALGLLQLVRGNILGPASSLLWVAWQIAAKLPDMQKRPADGE